MACHHVKLPNGASAIICTNERRKLCLECGRAATLLCDWKVPERRSGTCDEPICRSCATAVAPEKDLCPTHAREFERWKARHAAKGARHD